MRNVKNTIENFINPFQIEDPDNLYCIASGAPVPKDNENDLLTADISGAKTYGDSLKNAN